MWESPVEQDGLKGRRGRPGKDKGRALLRWFLTGEKMTPDKVDLGSVMISSEFCALTKKIHLLGFIQGFLLRACSSLCGHVPLSGGAMPSRPPLLIAAGALDLFITHSFMFPCAATDRLHGPLFLHPSSDAALGSNSARSQRGRRKRRHGNIFICIVVVGLTDVDRKKGAGSRGISRLASLAPSRRRKK